ARQLLATVDGSRLDHLRTQTAPELEAPIDDDPEARGGHRTVSVDGHCSFPPARRAATGSTSRPRAMYPKMKASMLTTHLPPARAGGAPSGPAASPQRQTAGATRPTPPGRWGAARRGAAAARRHGAGSPLGRS